MRGLEEGICPDGETEPPADTTRHDAAAGADTAGGVADADAVAASPLS